VTTGPAGTNPPVRSSRAEGHEQPRGGLTRI
jgi:hypothetical protein